MTWTKMEHQALRDPVIVSLTDAAWRVHWTGLAFCGEQLTDGDLAEAVVRTLHPKAVKAAGELVSAGLWERTPGGWRIVGYLNGNRSRAEVEALKEQKRTAGKKGGKAKAAAKQSASGVPSEASADDRSQLPDVGTSPDDDQSSPPKLGSSSKFWPIFVEAGLIASRTKVPPPKHPDGYATTCARQMQREQEWQLPELLRLRPDLEADPCKLAYIVATDGAGKAIEQAKEWAANDEAWTDHLDAEFSAS